MLVMWMGDRITEKGLGNGSSIIIFVGIISRIPSDLIGTVKDVNQGSLALWAAILIVVVMLITIIAVTYISEVVRKIPVQYAKRFVGRKICCQTL